MQKTQQYSFELKISLRNPCVKVYEKFGHLLWYGIRKKHHQPKEIQVSQDETSKELKGCFVESDPAQVSLATIQRTVQDANGGF